MKDETERNPDNTMAWRDVQDLQVDESLDKLAVVFNHESAYRRLWGLTDDLITEKHFINIAAVFKRDESFRLLDIGCGTGGLINKLGIYFRQAELYGLDSNHSSIEVAQQVCMGKCYFVNGSFEESLDLGLFDAVVCSEAFEHINDSNGLIDTIYQVLKPGGVLSFSTPSGWMYRTPRIYNAYKLMSNPRTFYCLYLHPERNWDEALPIHPAVQPRWLKGFLKKHGFRKIGRQSSLWLVYEFGILLKLACLYERISPETAALRLYNVICMLEGLMNVVPLFRIFESRVVFLMRREDSRVASLVIDNRKSG